MFKVNDVIDLNADIAWIPIEMDGKEESNNKEQEKKVVAYPPSTLLFLKKMNRLSFHYLPLKVRMKVHTISYEDLLCPNPLLPRLDEELMPGECRRLALQKDK